MPFIQLPGDSTGKLVETVTPALSSAGSTMHREVMAIGDHASTAIATVGSTAGLSVLVTNPSTSVTITNPSTAVSLSSAIAISSGTVTSTAATNPWSSAPSFNAPIVSVSSGLVQISGVPAFTVQGSSGGTVFVTTSGALSVVLSTVGGSGSTTVSLSSTPFFSLVGTSSAPATVTSSAGLSVVLTNLSGPVTTSAGVYVNLISTAGTAFVVTTSAGLLVNVSSTSRQYIIHTFNSSSSNSVTVVTTLPAIFYGWNLGNQTTSGAVSVKIYNTSSGAVGSTTQMQQNIPIPGGSAGAGNNFILPQGISCTGGITFAITANFAATSTGSVAANDVTGSLYYNM